MINQYPSDTASYGIKVARGVISGAYPFGGYGEAIASGAVTDNVLWANGTFVAPSAAGVQLSIVSTSASDAAAGTGIRSVEIDYLDASLVPMSEILILNGVTPVLTVATNIRFINNLRMQTFGSGKKAAGTITASNAGTVHEQINLGKITASNSARMVPAGKKLFIDSLFAGATSGSAAAKVIVQIAATKFGDTDYTSSSVFIPYAAAGYQDNSAGLMVSCPLVFDAGTIVAMIYSTDKAATINGSWFGWLENA